MVETGGTMNCNLVGKDFEVGCSQTLPSTWKLHSKEVLGYVVSATPTNDLYVSAKMVEKYLDRGYSEGDIFLTWNQGHKGQCASGINKAGNKYDSCSYVKKALSYLK